MLYIYTYAPTLRPTRASLVQMTTTDSTQPFFRARNLDSHHIAIAAGVYLDILKDPLVAWRAAVHRGEISPILVSAPIGEMQSSLEDAGQQVYRHLFRNTAANIRLLCNKILQDYSDSGWARAWAARLLKEIQHSEDNALVEFSYVGVILSSTKTAAKVQSCSPPSTSETTLPPPTFPIPACPVPY